MKSQIIILLAFLTMLLSCSKVNHLPENQGDEIVFADPYVLNTRSVLIESSDQMADGYSVFASKSVTDVSGNRQGTMFMNNTRVYKAGGVWKYDADESYHWSIGASHAFCGIFPYCDVSTGVLEYNVNIATHGLEILARDGSVIKTGVGQGGCPDILYDVVSYDEPMGVHDTPEPIQFNMKHASSIVTFNVANRSENEIASVSGRLWGAEKDGSKPGLFDVASKVSITDKVEWLDCAVGEGRFEFELSSLLSQGQTVSKAGQVLVIPQNINTTTADKDKLYLHLTVVFNNARAGGSKATKQYHVCLADIPLNGQDASLLKTWLPGKNYIYNLNVTSDFITCTVSVVPWIEDDFIDLK